MDDIKQQRVQWLAQVYSHDAIAISDETSNEHMVEMHPEFGMDHFIATFRPLTKLREKRGELQFEVGNLRHEADDLAFADLLVGDEVLFELRIRFEAQAPHRIHYWGSYPPLAKGVEVRRYQPADASGCAALERACPMELADGSCWIVDRGTAFNDYLELMAPEDAAVVTAHGEVIGFYSCALRPINFKGDDTYCVYQHHYRVHPDHRSGSVSHALANFVDPRRTFQDYDVQFPYSLIDPDNIHMQNNGFPAAEGLRIARLSIPTTVGGESGDLTTPSLTQICEAMNATHENRELFRKCDPSWLEDRWSRTANFKQDDYRMLGESVLGVWRVNELNILEHADRHDELRLSFALDYGFGDLNEFVTLIRDVCQELRQTGTTHLSFMCDTRAEEYALLKDLSDDEQLFALHTLPWIVPDLTARTLYCDAVYS
jgi:hypothetical protein